MFWKGAGKRLPIASTPLPGCRSLCVLRELKVILITWVQYNLEGNSAAAAIKKNHRRQSKGYVINFLFYYSVPLES